MKSSMLLVAASAVAVFSTTGYAQQAAPPPPPAADPVVYKPPLRGAPLTRVGGGTRTAGAALTLNVLAPGDTGYTTQDKPTIYWFVSEQVDSPVELTVTSNASLQEAAIPTLEIILQPPIAKGVHALRLADHGVTIKPGVEYQWFVAVVRNPAQRSNDTIAGGMIKRLADSDAVQRQLKQTSPAQWPAVYAEAGVWYDAIDQLSQGIAANRGNRQLHAQRAALLEQVGLREAAAFDRSSAN